MKNIVILGGGTAGWMTANLLQKKWRQRGIQISVVESPDIGIIGVGEGSTPLLRNFLIPLRSVNLSGCPNVMQLIRMASALMTGQLYLVTSHIFIRSLAALILQLLGFSTNIQSFEERALMFWRTQTGFHSWLG